MNPRQTKHLQTQSLLTLSILPLSVLLYGGGTAIAQDRVATIGAHPPEIALTQSTAVWVAQAQPSPPQVTFPPQCRRVAYKFGLKFYYQPSAASIVLSELPPNSLVSLVTQQGSNQPIVVNNDEGAWVQAYLQGFNQFGQRFTAVGWLQNNAIPPRPKSNLVNCK